MKKTGICPKCNSTKIINVLDESRYNNKLEISFGKSFLSTKYICCSCGYIEEYFENERDRQYIYEKFKVED